MTDNSEGKKSSPRSANPPSPVAAPAPGAIAAVYTPASTHPIRPGLFLTKWVFVPLFFAGLLVAFGAHLGANGPDRWYTDFVIWIVKVASNR